MFCNIADAETYNCTYKDTFDNETYQFFLVREENSFVQIWGGIKSKHKIVEENSDITITQQTTNLGDASPGDALFNEEAL